MLRTFGVRIVYSRILLLFREAIRLLYPRLRSTRPLSESHKSASTVDNVRSLKSPPQLPPFTLASAGGSLSQIPLDFTAGGSVDISFFKICPPVSATPKSYTFTATQHAIGAQYTQHVRRDARNPQFLLNIQHRLSVIQGTTCSTSILTRPRPQ